MSSPRSSPIEQVHLAKDALQITVFPEPGAKTLELIQLPTAQNFIWHNPRIEPQRSNFRSMSVRMCGCGLAMDVGRLPRRGHRALEQLPADPDTCHCRQTHRVLDPVKPSRAPYARHLGTGRYFANSA
jgi:hypothetical protein